MERQSTNLQQLLDQIDRVSRETSQVSVGLVLETVGRRSFGPLLSVVGLTLASPLSIIPGMPTTMGVLVLLLCSQLLLGRGELWIPHWLKKRSVSGDKVIRAVRKLRPVARFIDRRLRARLTVLVRGPTEYLIATLCLAIAVFMPLMELVPMSASSAGVVLATYGLSLFYCDGVLALLALVATAVTAGVVMANLLL